ncbi:hypothetical protein PUN28_011707 [Cardiocondyla obscurior]|uniref:Uncharacterized protein n=1 Tax=Cardiocondyla obscurior TaxID=286306 RepID=A0AAW2FGI6_9HYME
MERQVYYKLKRKLCIYPETRKKEKKKNAFHHREIIAKMICSSSVKASPIILVSGKKSRKFRMKDTASSLRNIHEDSTGSLNENECNKTDARTFLSTTNARFPRQFPRPPTKQWSKIQQLSAPMKGGRYCTENHEKQFVATNAGDCNSNAASFNIGIKREPPVDISARQKQEALLSHYRKMKRPVSRPETARGKRRRFKSRMPSKRWARRKCMSRFKIFREANGPRLRRIVEMIRPRGKKLRPKLLKCGQFISNKGEFSLQSKNSSCSHYCLTKVSTTETMNYPTKMDKNRVIRYQYLEEITCKKHH